MNVSPVFIGGCGRSGTTMLGAILGAHSDCLCVPEAPFKTDVLRFFDPAATESRQILAALVLTRRFRLWGLDPAVLQRTLLQFEGSFADGLLWLVLRYGEAVGKPQPRLWIDHTPSNV